MQVLETRKGVLGPNHYQRLLQEVVAISRAQLSQSLPQTIYSSGRCSPGASFDALKGQKDFLEWTLQVKDREIEKQEGSSIFETRLAAKPKWAFLSTIQCLINFLKLRI